jgi:AraC-like DNA-binding protein
VKSGQADQNARSIGPARKEMRIQNPPLHSIAGLAPALKVMVREGHAVQQCLKGTGVLTSQVDDQRQTVTLRQEIRFYRNLLELSGDPTIGLRIGAGYVPQRYGLFGYALMSAATLRHALVIGTKYGDLTFTWFGLALEVVRRTAVFSLIDRFDIDADVRNLLCDRDCAAGLVDLSEIMGQPLILDEVALPHDGHGRCADYRRFFQCPVQFGSVPARIEFAAEILETPLPHRDAAASDQLRQQCQLLLARLRRQSRLVDDVRLLLLARPGFFPDIGMVAETLGQSVRTLRRRLTKEGTTFQKVLDEVRFGLATQYLVETRLPLQEISTLLGYGEPGNFTHAFKRWVRQTPSAFRVERRSMSSPSSRS